MPRQLLLEGPAIEPLLQRVRSEHGSTARIIKAERVRVGGIAGFFAQERFEVTVQVQDVVEPPAPVASPPAPVGGPPTATGLHALLAAVEMAELSSRVERAAAPGDGRPAARAEEQEPAPPPAAPPVSTEGAGFEAVMTGLQEALRAQGAPGAQAPPAAPPAAAPVPVQAAPVLPLAPPAPLPAPPPPVSDAALPAPADADDGPATEEFEAVTAEPDVVPPPQGDAEPEPVVEAEPVLEAEPVGFQQLTAPTPFLDVFAELDRIVASAVADFAATPTPIPADRAPAPVPAAPAEPTRRPRTSAAPGAEAVAAVPTRRSLRLAAAARAEAAAGPRPVAERLAALGVDARWLHGLPDEQTGALRVLAERVHDLPCTPRRSPDRGAHHVVVVLAEGRSGLATAQALATGLGVRADEVLVLAGDAPPRPGGAAPADRRSAARVAELARHRERPVVVLVTVPLGPDPAAQEAVRGTLAALAPDQVWAVVDAARRAVDARAWLEQVGPPEGVDAVALTGTDATAVPAEALGLGAPVVLLDGRPASAVAWVSLLAARLTRLDLERHLAAS